MSIKKWLNKPFPFYDTYQQKILIPAILTIFVMMGIIILNWTTNSEMFWKQIASVLSYGSIVIFISITFSLILPEIFPKVFNTEKWNVLKTIIFIPLTILTIGIVITLIAYHFDNPNDLNFFSFFIAILLRSIILSFFPLILLVFYFERILRKRNHLTALSIIDELNKDRQFKQKQEKDLSFIFAKNTKDEIEIVESNLLYIKAEGNYCNLIYKSNLVLLRKLIRCSMKELEICMIKSDNIIRCHKSYIVNLTKISSVTGNAKGYLFHLTDHDCRIPGSRNLSKSLLIKIKAFQNNLFSLL